MKFEEESTLQLKSFLKELKKATKQVTTPEEIQQVATISANGDVVVGKLIADAFKAVGKEGVITVQTGKTFEHKLDIVEGIKIDRGFLSGYFLTDPKTLKCEYENPYILITDQKLNTIQSIQPILEAVARTSRALLIIAEDVEGDALPTLIVNKIRGSLKVVAIKSPGFGDNKKATLEDIATVTGGQVISEELGLKLENVTLSMLGTCSKVIVSKDDSVIMGGSGDVKRIKGRADEIRKQIETTESKYEKDKLKERLAKLTGGVAVINVGGASEIEVNEIKDLVDDSLNATRAAIEEGIVPGGGVALLRSSLALNSLKSPTLEQKSGVEIVKKAISQPAKSIASNAGESGDVVANAILSNKSPSFGFDARNGVYGDLYASGIIDPTKVVRLALINAASVASSIASAEVMIADAPPDPSAAPSLPPMGGGGGLY